MRVVPSLEILHTVRHQQWKSEWPLANKNECIVKWSAGKAATRRDHIAR
jgi:hypothetical protein